MRAVWAAAIVCAMAGPGAAQSTQTLADIRQELTVVFVELQKLKRELSTTGSPGVAIGGDVLQRVDALEAALTRLTSRAEALEFRIDAVVSDGTNRIGDLEFRLCELEPDCDIAALGETPTLGGGVAVVAPPVTVPSPDVVTTELAVGEQADFDAALGALDAGDFEAAISAFTVFLDNYPGSPLESEVQFYRAQALAEVGRPRDAGRAYLASFSGAPSGPKAPEALFGLGRSLGALNQLTEACTTLGEVGVRFPGSPMVAQANQERARLGCS